MQKITLEDLSESKSAIEDKSVQSGDRSHSVNSIQTTTHETTNVAVYEVGHVVVPVRPPFVVQGHDRSVI